MSTLPDYETFYGAFSWQIPETFNFAVDVVDYWADKGAGLALIWENEAGDHKRRTSPARLPNKAFFMAIGFEVQFLFTFRLFIFCYFFAIKITLSIVFHPILHVDFFNLFNLVLDYFYLILNESFFTENLLTFFLDVFLGFQHSCFEDLSLGGEEF